MLSRVSAESLARRSLGRAPIPVEPSQFERTVIRQFALRHEAREKPRHAFVHPPDRSLRSCGPIDGRKMPGRLDEPNRIRRLARLLKITHERPPRPETRRRQREVRAFHLVPLHPARRDQPLNDLN